MASFACATIGILLHAAMIATLIWSIGVLSLAFLIVGRLLLNAFY